MVKAAGPLLSGRPRNPVTFLRLSSSAYFSAFFTMFSISSLLRPPEDWITTAAEKNMNKGSALTFERRIVPQPNSSSLAQRLCTWGSPVGRTKTAILQRATDAAGKLKASSLGSTTPQLCQTLLACWSASHFGQSSVNPPGKGGCTKVFEPKEHPRLKPQN